MIRYGVDTLYGAKSALIFDGVVYGAWCGVSRCGKMCCVMLCNSILDPIKM